MKYLLLAAPLCLAGCADSETLRKAGESASKSDGDGARVVVAVLDSAFNPYHEFFYAGSEIYAGTAPAAVTPEVLAEFGIGPDRQIELTRSGSPARDLGADAAFWQSVKRGSLYWFKGTNLIATSFCEDPLPELKPDPGKNPHGVATSASVLRANPEAVLLLVETCSHNGFEDIEMAHWHPAVDIVSQSSSFLGPLPFSEHGSFVSVVQMGKLKFQAAGNAPNPTPVQGGPGNWWVVGVSGVEEYDSHGQPLLSSNLADFVSNYTDDLPYCMDCESGLTQVLGTSLSTPRAAGVASRVLLEARRAFGHGGGIVTDAGTPPALVATGGVRITNWDLRRALEEAAFTGYGLADYSISSGDTDPTAPANLPVNEAAPWLQLAWGDLSPEPDKAVVQEALAQLGLGTPQRVKPAGYCEFQSANIRLRFAYWDASGTARMMGETVPDPNPFRFCDSALPAG